jgi:quinol-cytochrome oxidoreductase complex cytochrome b subunit
LVTGTNLVAAIPLIGKPLYAIIVGGSQPGAVTLVRFYGWHLYGLAGLAGVLTVWHLFRVRRDGGIAAPPPLQRETRQRISRVELVRREVLAMLLTGVALLLLATFAPAPLAVPIGTPTNPENHILAPWFLLWVQELLKLGSPFLFGVIVPLAVFFLLTFIPYLPWKPAESEAGTWFPRSNRPTQVLVGIIMLALVLLTLLAILPAP